MKIKEDIEATLPQDLKIGVGDIVKIVHASYTSYYRVREIFTWGKCILENIYSLEKSYMPITDVTLYKKYNQ